MQGGVDQHPVNECWIYLSRATPPCSAEGVENTCSSGTSLFWDRNLLIINSLKHACMQTHWKGFRSLIVNSMKPACVQHIGRVSGLCIISDEMWLRQQLGPCSSPSSAFCSTCSQLHWFCFTLIAMVHLLVSPIRALRGTRTRFFLHIPQLLHNYQNVVTMSYILNQWVAYGTVHVTKSFHWLKRGNLYQEWFCRGARPWVSHNPLRGKKIQATRGLQKVYGVKRSVYFGVKNFFWNPHIIFS